MLIFCRPSMSQNGLKNPSWHICISLRSFKGGTAMLSWLPEPCAPLPPPLPPEFCILLYLLLLDSQYFSHPLGSHLSPISVITLLPSPHNALNIEGAYKYCWLVLRVFLDDLSPCWFPPSLTPLRFTVYPTQLTPYYPQLQQPVPHHTFHFFFITVSCESLVFFQLDCQLPTDKAVFHTTS